MNKEGGAGANLPSNANLPQFTLPNTTIPNAQLPNTQFKTDNPLGNSKPKDQRCERPAAGANRKSKILMYRGQMGF